MADGDNLIIGTVNQGDAETRLDRGGTQIKTAFVVTNANEQLRGRSGFT